MFTDIVDSTGMAARLGDARAVEMVRAHDAMVRRALRDRGGREIKHTGDGIMASFDDVAASVETARCIQQDFERFNRNSAEPLRVRIGIHAGEPLEDSNDLFGTTVITAARICSEAPADGIVVSESVAATLRERSVLTDLGARSLKGLSAPVGLYEVLWRPSKG
jgi:class 3 adenylate cyclase